MSTHGDAIESLLRQVESLTLANRKLRAALEAYPEWLEEEDDQAHNVWVRCLVCEAAGMFNCDGKPSKHYPPTHKPDCARQAALQPVAQEVKE